MANYRLEWGEPGPAADEDHRLAASFPEEETPVGADQVHHVADGKVFEHPALSGQTTRGIPDLQLDAAGLAGWIGPRPASVHVLARDGDLHVLARVEDHLTIQVDQQPTGTPRTVLDRGYRPGVVADRVELHPFLECHIGFKGDVGVRGRDTDQGLALGALVIHQREAG